MSEENTIPAGLALLREPFADHLISQLPKPSKTQTDQVKADFKKGIRCKICGSWHHPDVVHLSYVGHAALTHRLLEADPLWTWEPVAVRDGLPAFDSIGGLWIRLTVCGVTRLGYGDSQGKTGNNAIKECIGDALRNAAMRFGAALDLWHKGDLHADDEDPPADPPATRAAPAPTVNPTDPEARRKKHFPAMARSAKEGGIDALGTYFKECMDKEDRAACFEEKDRLKAALLEQAAAQAEWKQIDERQNGE